MKIYFVKALSLCLTESVQNSFVIESNHSVRDTHELMLYSVNSYLLLQQMINNK